MLEAGQTLFEPVSFSFAAGNTEIVSDAAFMAEMAGHYLFIPTAWYRIHRVTDAGHAHLSQPPSDAGSATSPVVMLNDIR